MTNQPKIFYYVQAESDYGPDVIYDGLCQAIGHENVLEYPHKPNYHSNPTGRYLHYPCLYDYPVTKTDEEKLSMLDNNEFDYIFVCCRYEDPNKLSSRYTGPIWDKIKNNPACKIIIDQGDGSEMRNDILNELSSKFYFKREVLTYGDGIPCSLAYSDRYIPKTIENRRDNFLFWAGQGNIYRQEYLTACSNYFKREKMSQEQYRFNLYNSKIGLNLRGFGYDCVRYYEIPAHGALLLSEKLPIIIENDFTDGENAIFFSNKEELLDKLSMLEKNPDLVEKIRQAGHEHFKKYHTALRRAEQILLKINKGEK